MSGPADWRPWLVHRSPRFYTLAPRMSRIESLCRLQFAPTLCELTFFSTFNGCFSCQNRHNDCHQPCNDDSNFIRCQFKDRQNVRGSIWANIKLTSAYHCAAVGLHRQFSVHRQRLHGQLVAIAFYFLKSTEVMNCARTARRHAR